MERGRASRSPAIGGRPLGGLLQQRGTDRLGFGLTVFVSIKTGEHSSERLKEFAGTVAAIPEVLEFHRVAGEVDYLLKVLVPDMKSFDAFYKHLIETTGLTEVISRFSMETIKETTTLPI